MFTTTYPPLPTFTQIRNMWNDEKTNGLLLRLRSDLAEGIQKLTPETLMAMAHQLHPECETSYHAVAMMGLEAVDALRSLAQHSEDTKNLIAAEEDRMKPMVSTAVRRNLAISRELDGVDLSLSRLVCDIEERRNKLRKSGVGADDIEAVLAVDAGRIETERTELNARRTALTKESDALAAFLRTYDETLLPEGFKVVEPPPCFMAADTASKYAVAGQAA